MRKEPSDNVISLDEYRARVGLDAPPAGSEVREDPVEPLRVTFRDGYASALREAADTSGQELKELMQEFVSYGLHQRHLNREGWEGPAYKRSIEHRGKLGRIATWFGLSEGWSLVRLQPRKISDED